MLLCIWLLIMAMLSKHFVESFPATNIDTTTDVDALMREALEKVSPGLASKMDAAVKECKLSAACKNEYDQLSSKLSEATIGIGAGSSLFAGISTYIGFHGNKGLSAVTSVLSSFMGALGPIVDMFRWFLSSSQMAQQMKQIIEILREGFNEMRGRFDDIDHQIGDLKNRMEELDFWGSVKDQLDVISHVDYYINKYFTLSEDIQDQTVADMKKLDLLNELQFAINSLMLEFTGEHDGWSVCKDLTSFTDVDRYQVKRISIKIFNQMVRGARNAILMSRILDRHDTADVEKKYVNMLTNIGESIDKCDSNIETKGWLNQWRKDLKRHLDDSAVSVTCAKSHPWVYYHGEYCCKHKQEKHYSKQGRQCDGSEIGMDSLCCKNDDSIRCSKGTECQNYVHQPTKIAEDIHEILGKKFFWREWSIVVYKRLGGHDRQYHSIECEDQGLTYINDNWKNYVIMVASSDKSSTRSKPSMEGYDRNTPNAQTLYYKRMNFPLDCNNVKIAGVFENTEHKIIAPEKSANIQVFPVRKKTGHHCIIVGRAGRCYPTYADIKFYAFAIA